MSYAKWWLFCLVRSVFITNYEIVFFYYFTINQLNGMLMVKEHDGFCLKVYSEYAHVWKKSLVYV